MHARDPDQTPAKVEPPASSALQRLGRSFYFAFVGLGYLFRTQRNARIHLFLAACAVALGWWLKIDRTQWAILTLAIAAVMILEGLNTALEAAVDLASPQRHPLAKIAKDLAAGMVLLAAIAAVVIGLLILGVPLWARLKG